jgi:uncharacterized protein (DUF885 family)
MILPLVAAAALTPMQSLADEYFARLWRDSPLDASTAGYHEGSVDSKLDELSPKARAARLAFLRGFATRVHDPRPNVEDEADRRLLSDAVALERLDLEEAHPERSRADRPMSALGDAFFQMVVRPYAPVEKRAADATARLRAVPRFLDQARNSLTTHVEAFAAAAEEDGQGLIEYLKGPLLEALGDKLKPDVDLAIDAITKYLGWVRLELPKKKTGTFRLGKALYAKRFGPHLQTKRTPDDVLAAAEKRAAEIRAEMAQVADKILPPAEKATTPERRIRAALALIGREHAARDHLLSAVRDQLRTTRQFVDEKKLLTLPAQDNLTVIDTPAFLRAFYGVAGFDPAPPLAPSQGAFYYVTPFPHDWPDEKVEAKLREYNRWMLELITIHEAMPGHYVQLEHANRVTPSWRRVLRFVLSSEAYVEGWATYVQNVVTDAGYLDNSPKLRLTALKLELRAVTNSILDIKLHTTELSDDDALRLMTDGAFQERPEAEGKLKRAKLSVIQLCTYFVGMQGWLAARKAAEARGLDARTFHDRALAQGAVPLDMLPALIFREGK